MTDFDNQVLRAQQGSKSALNGIIKYMYKCLYSTLTKRWQEIPGGHTAEDMIQFCMIAVLKAIKNYDGNGYSKSWIWRHVKSEIHDQSSYLHYDKRKLNLNSYSMDTPLKADKNLSFGHILPCRKNVEQESVDNVFMDSFTQGIRSELSELEFIVINYMLLDYATKDIIKVTDYTPKTIDNAKERIKFKVRRYLTAG